MPKEIIKENSIKLFDVQDKTKFNKKFNYN